MNIISLCVGDWSCDGHEKYKNHLIVSNLTSREVEDAVSAAYLANPILKMFKDTASEYEDRKIDNDLLQELVRLGFDKKIDPKWLCEDEFVSIYLFIVSVGNPKFQYMFLNEDTINIGGYGLFY